MSRPPAMPDEARCRRLIGRAIEALGLDLSGLSVLTEAATGYYRLTPLIAALAGAERVYALAADSRHGRAADVRDETLALAGRWGVAERLRVLLSKEDPLVGRADVVTNLGFVRPLDAPFLRRLKPTAVVPLMWETWEYRPEDLDLAECRRLGIPVLGTDEHSAELRIFDYVGHLALKLLFALDVEVVRSRVAVAGSGEFAERALASLRGAGAEAVALSTESAGALGSDAARGELRRADAVVVVEHHDRRPLIGPGGDISAEELGALNPALAVAHICGGVDRAALAAAGLRCFPERFAPPGYMSVATDYLGPRPLIDLHTAGLKVGEELARARALSADALGAERAVLARTRLAQGFAGYHDDQERTAPGRSPAGGAGKTL